MIHLKALAIGMIIIAIFIAAFMLVIQFPMVIAVAAILLGCYCIGRAVLSEAKKHQ